MDPPAALMNESSFRSENAGSYNLAEIWPFPIDGGAGVAVARADGGALELRRPHFAQFGELNREDSIVADQRGSHSGGASRGKRRDSPAVREDDSAKIGSTSGGGSGGAGVNDSNGKRLRATGSRDENCESKAEGEVSSGKKAIEPKPPQQSEPPKQDYIHVRARRGQATDSHSLAERARREKISERMKILQDLVPGCNKVIGKALVLDEIINYIQSLQRQVEFLSMKLEAVNSRMTSGIEAFPLKDFGQQTFDAAGVSFGSQASRDYARGSSPEWLHMQVGGGFERTS